MRSLTQRLWTSLVLLNAAALGAQATPPATVICLAPPSATMASGSNVEAANALRDLFASYLTGPTLGVKPLTARLPSQALEEAKQASCRFVLYATMKLERSQGNGALGRIVSGAVQSSASEIRGTSVATSAAGRVAVNAAASAAAEAAHGLATNVRSKDELTLDYHLDTIDGKSLAKKNEKAKASSDGQDLLTPLVERAAEAVASAAMKAK